MSTFEQDSDDDDDDMFIMRAGTLGSIYSSAPMILNDDDEEDDDDDVVEVTVEQKRKKRGRRAKLNDHLRPKPREVVSVDEEDLQNESNSSKRSVFNNIDDDVCIILDDDDPVVSKADDYTFRAQQAIANARELLGSKGDEEKIERDAEIYAKRLAEENARKEAERKAADDLAKGRALAQKSAGTSSGVTTLSDGPTITLRVRNGTNAINVKILTTDPLRKMLGPFCTRFGIDVAKAVMEVDGEEIEEADTATTYDLEDGCLIDVRVRK